MDEQIPGLLSSFEKHITAFQDLDRGIPFALMDEAQNPPDDPRERAALRARWDVLEEEQQRLAAELPLHEPPLTDTARVGERQAFRLVHAGRSAPVNWTEGASTRPEHRNGIWGWQATEGVPYPLGAGVVGPGRETYRVELAWSGTVPTAGAYHLPADETLHVIRGKHKVTGRGWAGSGNDATVEVWFWRGLFRVRGTYITEWLRGAQTKVSADATKSEKRTKTFHRNLPGLGPHTFTAVAGEQILLLYWLEIPVWANGDGSVRLWIDTFGNHSLGNDDYKTVYSG